VTGKSAEAIHESNYSTLAPLLFTQSRRTSITGIQQGKEKPESIEAICEVQGRGSLEANRSFRKPNADFNSSLYDGFSGVKEILAENSRRI
jgi:hypothetical protein